MIRVTRMLATLDGLQPNVELCQLAVNSTPEPPGLAASMCCHTFRATGITAYLLNGGTLEHAQRIRRFLELGP